MVTYLCRLSVCIYLAIHQGNEQRNAVLINLMETESLSLKTGSTVPVNFQSSLAYGTFVPDISYLLTTFPFM